MKKLLLVSLALLVSCVPAQATTSPPISTATPVQSVAPTSLDQASPEMTVTSIPPTSTPTPILFSTSTPIPCDPFLADFCITEGHFLFQRPIRPPANDSVDRTYPFASTANGTRDPHHGVEFQVGFGTPVHAAADGLVIFAGPSKETNYNPYSPWYDFYGNLVVIRHEDDLYTLYAHLSAVYIAVGDRVVRGEQVGEVGQSGAATGSHLHFEVRRGDVEDYFSAVNPELWLLPSRAELGVMELSVLDEKSEFQQASITLQCVDESGNVVATYFIETYHPALALGHENAAIGDLLAGRYRATMIFNGHFYERWVEVQSGKLTQVVFVVK